MSDRTQGISDVQEERNQRLLRGSLYLGREVSSSVLPGFLDIDRDRELPTEAALILSALELEAAATAIRAVGELAKLNEVDHLGGGLGMISALTLTGALVDHEKIDYTLENAHASIGYFSVLSAYGFLKPQDVIDRFRRSLDIAGHVAWVPGGTQLNGGRLGVMVPAAVGQALGRKARFGNDAWVICHCGDAGWISGQALNGFNAAFLHGAPVTFVMDRNGIQLSGSNRAIMDRDPRPILESLGITIVETKSLHDLPGMYRAYRQARDLARSGRPSLVYPVGIGGHGDPSVSLKTFGDTYGVLAEVSAFAAKHGVPLDTPIWIPGSLMSFRDVEAMIECLFLVNQLPGGKGHHDGHMKGRDVSRVLSHPILQPTDDQRRALRDLRKQDPRRVVTRARPAPGTPNLLLPADAVRAIELPGPGKSVSPRLGSQLAYEALAKIFPDDLFLIDCDLGPSTKIDKARERIARDHQFEMSIEEQASAIMANGLAMSTHRPQLVVFATFAAFFEGIAREGFEMWRYQRNLTGVNEGLNVTYHLSHVGACTGRDHFSGWSLDWVTLAMGYLPYLHRFYAPADARAAFIAVRDLAAHYGGHILAIPRDNLPILSKQDGSGPLFDHASPWEAITACRRYPGSRAAILAFGATAFLAVNAAENLQAEKRPVDVYVVNGLPLPVDALASLLKQYPGGLVTAEDGITATRAEGLRGFAGLVSSASYGTGVPLAHIGIEDPRTAPSDGHLEVWAHFGITAEAIAEACRRLGQ